MIRLLSPALFVLLLGGSVVSMPVQAQPQSQRSVQWRDLTLQIPRADWNQVSPDPDPKWAGRRLFFARQEALHYGQINVYPLEAPSALAPSEVAEQFYETQKKGASGDGRLSEVKTGLSTIGGAERPVLSVRFTPAAGTPITDSTDVLLFPADYAQRQRYLVVQWADSHSATTAAASLDELDSFISSLVLKPLGTLLVADDFSDRETGAMHTIPTSEHYTVGYLDGEYAIQKTDADWPNAFAAAVPGTFADLAVSVDAYVTAVETGPRVFLYCRRTVANGSYRAAVDPSGSRAQLQRIKPDNSIVNLSEWISSDAIQSGTSRNHLNLQCRGSEIALDANGTRIVTVRNGDVLEGNAMIGGGAAGGLADVRFANLSVTQR
jgi:hypothetical protein